MKPKGRLLICCLLLAMTAGLCVQYAGADLWASSGTATLATDGAAADGQTVFLFAIVQETNTAAGEIRTDHTLSRVDIQDVDPAVVERLEPGASIQVYGTRHQSQIDAEQIVIDFATDDDRWYTYGSSILGVLLAAGVFFRFWRLNWRELGFEPRGEN